MAFTLFEEDALEVFQFRHWTGDFAHQVANVELNHFCTVVVASVAHFHRYGEAAILIHSGAADGRSTVLECGVRLTVAEWIERSIVDVEVVAGELSVPSLVWAASVEVAVVDRNLTYALRHRHAEVTAWSHVAKHHVADGVASFATAKPYVENGAEIFLFPVHHSGTAREVEQYDRLASGFESGEQVFLCVEDFEVGAAAAFASHFAWLANASHHHIGLLCNLHCFGTHHVGIAVVAHFTAKHGAVFLHDRIVAHVATLSVEHFCLALHGFGHGFAHGFVLVHSGCHAPCARHIGASVGKWANERNLALLCQWEHIVAVFKKHESFGSQLAGCRTVLVGVDFSLGTLAVEVAVWVVEQAEFVFSLKNAAASSVDSRHAHLAFVERLFDSAQETVSHHIHICAGVEREGRHGLQVAHAVGNHFADGSVVGHHKALKSPHVAEHGGHQPLVASGRNVVNGVERSHHRSRASIHGCLVGWEVFVKHASVAHVGGVVVAASLSCAIEGEVLHTRHHGVGGGEVGALVAFHHSLGDL